MGFVASAVLFVFCVLGAAWMLNVRGVAVTVVGWVLIAAMYFAPADFQAGLFAWADYTSHQVATRASDWINDYFETHLPAVPQSSPGTVPSGQPAPPG